MQSNAAGIYSAYERGYLDGAHGKPALTVDYKRFGDALERKAYKAGYSVGNNARTRGFKINVIAALACYKRYRYWFSA